MNKSNSFSIRFATADDSQVIGDLVVRLLCELVSGNYYTTDEGAFVVTTQNILCDDNGF